MIWFCPDLLRTGLINPELQKKVLEFVFKVQGIKEPAVAEKIYDFAQLEKFAPISRRGSGNLRSNFGKQR